MWIFIMLPPYYSLFNVDIYNTELWYLTSLSTICKLYRSDNCSLVEETRLPGENHRPAGSHQQTLSLLYRVHLAWVGFELPTLVIIGRECITSYRKKFHLPYDHDHYVYWHWVFIRTKAYVKFYIYFIKVWQTRMQFYMIKFNQVRKKTSVQFYIDPKFFFFKYVNNFLF